jgi:hypothetical protein
MSYLQFLCCTFGCQRYCCCCGSRDENLLGGDAEDWGLSNDVVGSIATLGSEHDMGSSVAANLVDDLRTCQLISGKGKDLLGSSLKTELSIITATLTDEGKQRDLGSTTIGLVPLKSIDGWSEYATASLNEDEEADEELAFANAENTAGSTKGGSSDNHTMHERIVEEGNVTPPKLMRLSQEYDPFT